jgi:hypothetical protein
MFQGHEDLVSCLATIPGEAKLVASGGGDGRVCLWDTRMRPESACVAAFSCGEGARAHSQLVSSLDASGPRLASCSMDSTMCVWDVRGAVRAVGTGGPPAQATIAPLTQQNVDGSDILKVALRPGSGLGAPARPDAAVITMRSAYVLDLSPAIVVSGGAGGSPATATATSAPGRVEVVPVELFQDVIDAAVVDKMGPYQDVRWLRDGGGLVCAGNTGRLDVLAVQ